MRLAKQGIRFELFAALSALTVLVALAAAFKDQFRTVVLADPSGIKYTGAGKCAAAACHGSASPVENAGTTLHNENTLWAKKDKHAKAFKSLKSSVAATAAMEKALNLKAESSTRCTSCHALSGLTLKEPIARLNLTADQIDPKGYGIEDGVSCDACHGPAEKYVGPHVDKGWTQKQHDALSVNRLYDEWGLYYTKDMKMRANTCVSCHLKIEADLVAAGHPVPRFDQINVMGQGEEWVHWVDKAAWSGSKAWGMVRIIGLREAALQLGERAVAKTSGELLKDAYSQMAGLLLPVRQIAAVVAADQVAPLNSAIVGIHEGWADGAKVDAACKTMASAAEAVADKFNAAKFEQPLVEKFMQGIASEAALANLTYYTAYHHCWSLYTLATAIQAEGKLEGGDEKIGKVESLFEALGDDQASYDATKYEKAAKEAATWFPGGTAQPFPSGGPTK